MATRDQLMQALRNASVAADQGDAEAAQAARQLARMLHTMPQATGEDTPAQHAAFKQQLIDEGVLNSDGSKKSTNPLPVRENAGQRMSIPGEDLAGVAAHVGQGLSFGFGDEIAGAANALVGPQSYAEARDENRQNLNRYRENNPGKALAGELAGGLLTGGTGAARTGALKGAQTLGKLAGVGAVQGGIYGAGQSEADSVRGVLEDTAQGAALGGVTAGVTPVLAKSAGGLLSGGTKAVNRTLGGGLNNLGKKFVKVLDDAGIPLTAGQRGGSAALQQTETTLGSVPLVGGAIEDVLSKQRQKFQQKILTMAGFADDDVVEGLVTPEALSRAKDRFTGRYTDALKDVKLDLGDDFVSTLAKVQKTFTSQLTGGKGGRVNKIVNNLFDQATDGTLTGKKYQKLRSELGELARTSGNKPRIKELYTALKRSLDDAFMDSVDNTTAGVKKTLDQEYAQFKQVESLANRLAGGTDDLASGNLPVSQLANLAAKSPGGKQWKELTQAGKAILPDKVPNSGTASRAITGGLLAGGSAFNPAVLPFAAGANIASRGLANPQAVQRGAQAIGRGIQPLGLLATPGVVANDARLGLPSVQPQGLLQ